MSPQQHTPWDKNPFKSEMKYSCSHTRLLKKYSCWPLCAARTRGKQRRTLRRGRVPEKTWRLNHRMSLKVGYSVLKLVQDECLNTLKAQFGNRKVTYFSTVNSEAGGALRKSRNLKLRLHFVLSQQPFCSKQMKTGRLFLICSLLFFSLLPPLSHVFTLVSQPFAYKIFAHARRY